MNNRLQPRRHGQRGMMLLEVLIAMVIFAVGVLGMVKMQAVSTANSVNSEDRSIAALYANDLISELWAYKSAAQPADYSTWQSKVASSGLRSVDTSATTFTPPTATIIIKWTRSAGLNVEGNSSMSTQAVYATQVTIQ